jgi:hypothetical protein
MFGRAQMSSQPASMRGSPKIVRRLHAATRWWLRVLLLEELTKSEQESYDFEPQDHDNDNDSELEFT